MQNGLRFHWIRFWIGWVTGLQVLGWGLSLLGQLGSTGYAVGLPLVVLGAFLAAGFRRPTNAGGVSDDDADGAGRGGLGFPGRIRFRWRRLGWLPRIFLVIAAGSLVTGLVYAPNNGDGLGYRTPRVLNWLSAGHWYWIDALDARQNTRTVTYEWVTAPFLALTGSDRLLPLLSLVSYLLLPGLLFGLWRGLVVSRRVSWWWMWLLPTGYGFALQASGILTDLFGTVFCVAAVQLALMARQRQDASAARFSLLAAALMVGSKVSSLPLLLPWALAIWPAVPLLLRQKWALALTAALALVSSNVPTAVLNIRYCGDWKGLAAETRAQAMIGHGSAGTYLLHNAGLLLTQNLNPPVLPMAAKVNRWIESHLPEPWIKWLAKGSEDGSRSYRFREMAHEDFSGLGLPVTLLLGGLLMIRCWPPGWNAGASASQTLAEDRWLRAVVWSPWVAFLVYATQSGITSAGRLIMPYYPLMMTGLLAAPCLRDWVRRPVWRCATVVAAASSVLVCVLSPMRPWLPILAMVRTPDSAATATTATATAGGSASTRERLAHAYQVCAERATGFDPFLARVPADEQRIGMLAHFQFLEAPLWRPYGHHLVIRPAGLLTQEAYRSRGVRYVVLRVDDLRDLAGGDLNSWLRQGPAEVLYRAVYCHFPVENGTEWALVKLN